MAAGVYNFLCEQGTTFTRVLTITDNSGEVMDLSGYTARMQVRKDFKSTTVMVELTTENGRISLNDETGEITLTIPASVTATIAHDGIYDLELVDSFGVVTRLLKGKFEQDPEVTR